LSASSKCGQECPRSRALTNSPGERRFQPIAVQGNLLRNSAALCASALKGVVQPCSSAFAWLRHDKDERSHSSLHSDAVEERSAAAVGVGAARGAGLAGDVAVNGREHRAIVELGRALEVIRHTAHALPTHDQTRNAVGGREHSQQGDRVRWVGAGAPFLPVVKAVVIGIEVIRRASVGRLYCWSHAKEMSEKGGSTRVNPSSTPTR